MEKLIWKFICRILTIGSRCSSKTGWQTQYKSTQLSLSACAWPILPGISSFGDKGGRSVNIHCSSVIASDRRRDFMLNTQVTLAHKHWLLAPPRRKFTRRSEIGKMECLCCQNNLVLLFDAFQINCCHQRYSKGGTSVVGKQPSSPVSQYSLFHSVFHVYYSLYLTLTLFRMVSSEFSKKVRHYNFLDQSLLITEHQVSAYRGDRPLLHALHHMADR